MIGAITRLAIPLLAAPFAAGSSIQLTDVDAALHTRISARMPGQAVAVAQYSLGAEQVDFGKVRTSLDGLAVAKDTAIINNCSEVAQQHSLTLAVGVTTGREVTITNGLQSTKRTSISFGIGEPGKRGMQFSDSTDITASISRADRQSSQQTENRSEQFARTIPPRTRFIAELTRQLRQDEIDFTATVIANGTVRQTTVSTEFHCPARLGNACLTQQIPIPRFQHTELALHDVLPESERQFVVKGTLRSVTATETLVTFRSEEIKDSSGVLCTANRGENLVHPVSSEGGIRITPTSGSTPFAFPLSNSGSTIGPADGVGYRILFSREIVRMSPACGYNDLGFPNGAVFLIEEREYSEHRNGTLVRTWAETRETFVRCHSI